MVKFRFLLRSILREVFVNDQLSESQRVFSTGSKQVRSLCVKQAPVAPLSESRSGSAWRERYRKDFGSRQGIWRVVRK